MVLPGWEIVKKVVLWFYLSPTVAIVFASMSTDEDGGISPL